LSGRELFYIFYSFNLIFYVSDFIIKGERRRQSQRGNGAETITKTGECQNPKE
jgi:hypothetical protein